MLHCTEDSLQTVEKGQALPISDLGCMSASAIATELSQCNNRCNGCQNRASMTRALAAGN